MTPRSFATAGLLALAVLALAAAPANAAFTLANFTGSQPTLAGDGWVHVEGDTLFFNARGPFDTKLFTLPVPPGRASTYGLDASASRVAFVHASGRARARTFSAYTAPLRPSMPEKIAPVADATISVADDVVAYRAPGEASESAIARNFGPGGGIFRVPVPAAGSAPQVAGRYLAIATDPVAGTGEVIVFDRTTAAEVYRTPPVGRLEFSLGEDGVVVVSKGVSRTRCTTEVTWSSPADRSLHTVRLGDVCGAARYAGGRVAAVRQATSRTVELVLSDLAGTTRLVATQPIVRAFPAAGLFLDDISPTRLLWGQRHCDHRTVVLQDGLDSPIAATPPPAVECPIAIAGGSRLTVSSDGKVTIPVACPRLCTDVDIGVRSGRGRIGRAIVGLVFSRGPSMPVAVPLSRGALRELARSGSLQATISASTQDVDGRARRATKRVTLVR